MRFSLLIALLVLMPLNAFASKDNQQRSLPIVTDTLGQPARWQEVKPPPTFDVECAVADDEIEVGVPVSVKVGLRELGKAPEAAVEVQITW